MKMKVLISLLYVLTWSMIANAQELYTPRHIKLAYQSETRSLTGAPGAKYWQNKGQYAIQVTVNPDTKIVSGQERILYKNNSLHALNDLAIRFVNNVHKPTAVRALGASEDFLTSGLKLKSFKLNGKVYLIDSKEWTTVSLVKLSEAIPAQSAVTVDMEWEYPLSAESDREGQIDSGTYYCAYAYPRISVYDDYNGWDVLEHNGRQEFYQDFNDYKFEVRVPKNYVVWATGTFLNPEEVLEEKIQERFQKSLVSDEVIAVASVKEMQENQVTKQNDWNTWKFEANHISDFCFALSNHYVWDASSIQLKDKRVSVQAAYLNGTKDFEQYVGWERYCIDWFSKNWPGVEYPFSTMTAVQGFADMEYPMMVNDSSVPDNLMDARQTVDHEIAHTYFPFYMGINETRYAFMDEGWATALELLIGIDENGEEAAKKLFKDFRVKGWIEDPSSEEDQPLITLSSQLSGKGYGNNAYIKSALSYLALKDYLGDQLFKKALHHYMNNWNGKHPTPWDYFYSFNTGAGKNLNWFWNNWYFSNHYIDLKLTKVQQKNNVLALNIDNVGGFVIPFDVVVTYANGQKENVHFTPEVWEKNQKSIELKVKVKGQVKDVTLANDIFMDYTIADNHLAL
ncbi:M1 family metallopeptidase [Sphingobacterium sp. SRCM116780]|uniref:M1 family metallopeptidase n=1 Tax=Sphingobacterium sp. SRCM116780 TaxID=2907623 RepID=UPI001F4641C5|nr:M1 family metallopeptidase [Sphingobacterium sp. SRCM116780]UIR56930.1 M1 family metallopeptidase [Sphingobacterium sp. SRCM116780]